MTALHVAAGLALLAAVGHSFLSERLILAPLRREAIEGGVFSEPGRKRLAVAMFHLASLCWAGLAMGLLLLDPEASGDRETLHVFAAIYGISGLGNFWAVGRPHPGGVLLLSAAGLVLFALHA